jgi:hypothetical protein
MGPKVFFWLIALLFGLKAFLVFFVSPLVFGLGPLVFKSGLWFFGFWFFGLALLGFGFWPGSWFFCPLNLSLKLTFWSRKGSF